ncbi:MAG: flavodoxin [Pyramidobacter sp.]|nr:flavodoxin [Pyramidobacter sp.]
MSKKLVAYFSASGVTAKVAQKLSEAIGADLWEIAPAVPYTQADLDWTDKNSRSTREMADHSFRPPLAKALTGADAYDVVFIGFPIWWYIAPTIINTFLESCNLTGKTVIPFATSGGSGMGRTNEKLQPSCPGSRLLEGKVFSADAGTAELSAWAEGFRL